MSFFTEVKHRIQAFRESGPPDPQVVQKAQELREKFDSILGNRGVVHATVGYGYLPYLPLHASTDRELKILLLFGQMKPNEYFCTITGAQSGLGFRLQGVKPEAFPITQGKVKKSITFEGETGNSKDRRLHLLNFGNRIADGLVFINTRDPRLFVDGY